MTVKAVATVPFVFDRSFSIYGGNAASTLAGEFAFTISLALALVFLCVVLRGLETGRSRALAAVLLGLTVCCHLIPAIFAIIGAGVALLMSFTWTRRWAIYAAIIALFVVGLLSLVGLKLTVLAVVVLAVGAVALHWRDRDELLTRYTGNRLRAWWVASVVGIGALLTGFWTIPFLLRRQYLGRVLRLCLRFEQRRDARALPALARRRHAGLAEQGLLGLRLGIRVLDGHAQRIEFVQRLADDLDPLLGHQQAQFEHHRLCDAIHSSR